jgi:transposase
MQNVIGIDVSKKKLDVCAIFDGKSRKKIVDNSVSGLKSLRNWIFKNNINYPHICMESTGCYSEGVAEFFHELGFKVSVVNPLQIKAFRNSKLIRQKTDSVDAQVIAEFCLQNAPAPWKPRSSEQKELHNLNVRISALKSELHRSSNALENENLSKVILKSIRDEIKFLKKQIDLLENESRKIIDSNQNLKEQFDRITEIKGVGEKLALAIIAVMPDVSNFQESGQFSAFAGVSPSHFESGSSVHGKSHISRLGSKSIRKVLYMSALVVKNHNPHFRKFVRKLQKKGKAPKVIIVAIMRKLMCILFGMLKNSSNFDPKLAFYA